MKRTNLFITLTSLLAGIFLLNSCNQATIPSSSDTTSEPTLSEIFSSLIIPDEEIISTSSTSSASRATASNEVGSQNNPSPYNEWCMNTGSRGSIFNYMLKYDLINYDQIKKAKGNINVTIDWDSSNFSETTKKFIKDNQGTAILNYMMDSNLLGTIKITGTENNIQCLQTSKGTYTFNHYIILKKNNENKYDIEFYAYENLGSLDKYFELTSVQNKNKFTVQRWKVTGSSITNSTLANPVYLTFENNIVKKYEIQTSYVNYCYGDLSSKTGAVLAGSDASNLYHDYGLINDKSRMEVVRRDISNTRRYNLMFLESKDSTKPLTKAASDSYSSGQDGTLSSSDCIWTYGGTNLVSLSPAITVWGKFTSRDMNSYYEKAYYVDMDDSNANGKLQVKASAASFTDTSTLDSKVNAVKTSAATTASFSSAEIANIAAGMAKIVQ